MIASGRLRIVGTLCAAMLTASACADDRAGDEALDPGTAAVLADGADRLAAQLDGDDGCAVLDEAAALVARARDGVAAATVPVEVAREVEAVVADVTEDAACDDAPPPEVTVEGDEGEPGDPAEDAAEDGDGGDGDDGDEDDGDEDDDRDRGDRPGKGRGKGKGR